MKLELNDEALVAVIFICGALVFISIIFKG